MNDRIAHRDFLIRLSHPVDTELDFGCFLDAIESMFNENKVPVTIDRKKSREVVIETFKKIGAQKADFGDKLRSALKEALTTKPGGAMAGGKQPDTSGRHRDIAKRQGTLEERPGQEGKEV